MSTIKLEIKGNFLKITDNINGNDEVLILGITKYFFSKNDTLLNLRTEQGTNQITYKYLISVLVDSTDTPFASLSALEDFLSENLGGTSGEVQTVITTSVDITTNTTGSNGLSQKGVNTVIDNGINNINITVDTVDGFLSSYLKEGSGNVTFVQGAGRTLIQVDGTAVIDGSIGSTAVISSVGTNDYLRISNA